MSIEAFYKPLTIYRNVPSSTPGQTPTEITIGFYKGFIQQVSSDELFKMGKSAEESLQTLYTYMSTPALKGDRINQSGQNYRVVSGVTQPTGISGVNHHKEIKVKFIK